MYGINDLYRQSNAWPWNKTIRQTLVNGKGWEGGGGCIKKKKTYLSQLEIAPDSLLRVKLSSGNVVTSALGSPWPSVVVR